LRLVAVASGGALGAVALCAFVPAVGAFGALASATAVAVAAHLLLGE
jgi:hypothetical protein